MISAVKNKRSLSPRTAIFFILFAGITLILCHAKSDMLFLIHKVVWMQRNRMPKGRLRIVIQKLRLSIVQEIYARIRLFPAGDI